MVGPWSVRGVEESRRTAPSDLRTVATATSRNNITRANNSEGSSNDATRRDFNAQHLHDEIWNSSRVSKTASDRPQRTTLATLNSDVLLIIFNFLSIEDIVNLRLTCKDLAAVSRERSVWVKQIRRTTNSYEIPDLPNFVQPSLLHVRAAEDLASRPHRLAKALASPCPSATARTKSYKLDFGIPGFQARAISEVVHGRYLAVIGDIPADLDSRPAGTVLLFDLGLPLANAEKLAEVRPKVKIDFIGTAVLVDIAPLLNGCLLIAYAFNLPAPSDISWYHTCVFDLRPESFGRRKEYDFDLMTPRIVDASLCRDMIALDLERGAICLINWEKKAIGVMTCRPLQTRHGSRGKAIQLIPGAVLLADTFYSKVFTVPLTPLWSNRSTVKNPVPTEQDFTELLPLPAGNRPFRTDLSWFPWFGLEGPPPDESPPEVRFLRPPISHPNPSQMTLCISSGTGHQLLQFGTQPQVFGKLPQATHTLPLVKNAIIARAAQVGDEVVLVTSLPGDRHEGLGVITTPAPAPGAFYNGLGAQSGAFNVHAVQDMEPMDGIEQPAEAHRPLMNFAYEIPNLFMSVWTVLSGTHLRGHRHSRAEVSLAPRSKRSGVVFDDVGGRLVMVECQTSLRTATRVRIVEYS